MMKFDELPTGFKIAPPRRVPPAGFCWSGYDDGLSIPPKPTPVERMNAARDDFERSMVVLGAIVVGFLAGLMAAALVVAYS